MIECGAANARGPSRWATAAAALLAASTIFGGRREAPAEAGAEGAREEAAKATSRLTRGGLSITFGLSNAEAGAKAKASFTITNEATGAPVRGLAPLGWMSRRASGGPPDEAACKARIEGHVRGLLTARADVDMSGHDLWLLNREGTISVLDPTVAFSRTKLAAQIALPGRPGAWAMSQDRLRVLVTLPTSNEVAIVDVEERRVVTRLAVGRSPDRVITAPLGQRAFVGNEGDSTVSVLDLSRARVEETLTVGPGRKELALVDRGRALFITSGGGDRATVVDTTSLAEIARVPVPRGVTAIAVSDPAGVVHVASAETGEITLVDSARWAPAGKAISRPGTSRLGVDPTGRFVFALDREGGAISILDAATGRALREIGASGAPDAVAFTSAFAYVRRPAVAQMSVIELNTLDGAGSPAVVDVPIGQATAGGAERLAGAVIAPIPEGNGVVAVNPDEGRLHRYVEGMMAPMGTHKGPSRSIEGVLVVDRRLTEVSPGVYEAPVSPPEEGTFDVALLLGEPRVFACFEREVARAEGAPAAPAPLEIEPLFDPRTRLLLGEASTLRFRLLDEGGLSPVEPEDVEVLVLQFPGSHRQRLRARDPGDGTLAVTFTPRSAGQYRLLALVEPEGTPLSRAPYLTLNVAAKEER